MSKILGYITAALQGLERYISANKMIVLLVAVLLATWLAEKKAAGEKDNRMLVYTLIMVLLLLCPITAVVIMVYQTSFYDYEWAWAMIPVTAVIAYGVTLLVDKTFQKRKVIWGIGVVTAFLFLCGNQGRLQALSDTDAQAKANLPELLQCMNEKSGQKLLWAPKNIMQEVRRQDGNILLIYGRDMWDAKAGSYDYEAYNESFTQIYLWLEQLVEWENQLNGAEDAWEQFSERCEENKSDASTQDYLWIMVDAGVNTYILPNMTAKLMEEELSSIAAQRMLEVDISYTEEYTIYFLK